MDIFLKSVLGGILIGTVLFSARFFGPKIAGILTAIPFVFTISFLFGFSQKPEIATQNFILNVFVSAVLTAIFLGIFYFLNSRNYEKLFLNLAISFTVYFLLLAVLINYKK